MARTHSLKTRITVMMALLSLAVVGITCLLSHRVINRQFLLYVAGQREQKTEELLGSLSSQYYFAGDRWDMDFIHTIGMYALYDGFIITVNDAAGREIWDAQTHDMSSCYQVMNDIRRRMEARYPSAGGEFTVAAYPLEQEGQPVGEVQISYYGPYFLSEADFDFLSALDRALAVIALCALAVSLLAGRYAAERISRPVLRAVSAANQLMGGNYGVRLEAGAPIRELEQLTGSVNQLAHSLDRQERLRRQLTADVAHELRTPLTTVGTHLEAMMEGVWEPTQERLQTCHEEIRRLGSLVAELEGLARVEHGNLALEKKPLRFWQCAGEALALFSLEITRKGLRVEKQGGDAVVQADPDRLHQVLCNLLSNAIKYTPEGGLIEIAVEEDGPHVVFSVRDTGAGIGAEDLPHIFERFYRGDKSRSRGTGGAGIGLAVVQSIVQAHGGFAEAESKPGAGSVFRVALPRA